MYAYVVIATILVNKDVYIKHSCELDKLKKTMVHKRTFKKHFSI